MAPSDSERERSPDLSELVRELRSEIVEVLVAHRVPEDAAAQILHDTLTALAIRWNRVTNHRAWIVSTLEARCRAWSEGRGEAPGRPGLTPPDEPSGEGPGGGGP